MAAIDNSLKSKNAGQSEGPPADDILAVAIYSFANEFGLSLSYASMLLSGSGYYYANLASGRRLNSDKRIQVWKRLEEETEMRRGKALAGKAVD
jgi:hypothetical protein